MLRYFFILLILFFSFSVKPNENLLTIQQQLERLQREVSDLSQTVFSNDNNNKQENDNYLATNLSAIDMRIYDLEKDVKSLTSSFEEIMFKIDDLILKIENYNTDLSFLEQRINSMKNFTPDKETFSNEGNSDNFDLIEEENTLGSLKITNEKSNIDLSDNEKTSDSKTEENVEISLSVEDQFQLALDNIRKKNWDEGKKLLSEFIKNNSENQLSGSAHYWLGELHLLEKKFRDAALVFAEGYQKFPESIKAPDMLLKLSYSLYEVEKLNESCNTLEKLILDFPKNKLIKTAKKKIQEFGCLEANE